MLAPKNFSIQLTQCLFCLIFSEQGRCKKLFKKRDGPLPQHPDDRHLLNSNTTKRSLVSTPVFSTNIISDRVHCDPLPRVASGSRCHIAEYLKETMDANNCDLVLCTAYPPHGSMSFSRPVQTPPFAHSERLRSIPVQDLHIKDKFYGDIG